MSLNIARLLLLAGVLIPSIVAGGVDDWGDDDIHPSPTQGFYAFPNGPTGGWETVFLETEFAPIQRLSLPAGSCIANGMASLASFGPSVNLVDCIFFVGGGFQGEMSRGSVGGGPSNFTTLPLTIGFRINGNRQIAIACRADTPGVVLSQPSPITAIRVDRLSIRSGFKR
jgi:hypothetical protein